MNPAVTLAAMLYGQMAFLPALCYVLAQLLGSVIGFGGMMATSPPALFTTEGVGMTLPAKGVSPLAAAITEAVLTGMLALALCGVWASHNPVYPDNCVPLKMGAVVTGLVYAGVSLIAVVLFMRNY